MNRDQLLAAWLEGDLDASDVDALKRELAADEEFAREARRQLQMRRLLGSLKLEEGRFADELMHRIREESVSHPGSVTQENVILRLQDQRRWRRHRWTAAWVGIAAAIGILLAIFPRSPNDSVRVLAAEGIGSLDVRSLQEGQPVKFSNGILEFALGEHARIVIEAPARFAVEAADLVRLERGRCYVEMEKGRSGLRVVTPTGEVLDLGTRFGVEVAADKNTAVHVFEGAVEIGAKSMRSRLAEGEGMRLSPTGVSEPVMVESTRFVQRLPEKRAHIASWLHWSFEEETGDQAWANGEGFSLDEARAKIHGAKRIAGPSGRALEFDGVDDWVGSGFAGIPVDRERTVACWVRVPAQFNPKQGVAIVGWGKHDLKDPDRQGRSAWELTIRGNLKTPETVGHLQLNLGGPLTVGEKDLRDDRWHHVAAVTLNGSGSDGRGTILLYVDGDLEPRTFGRGVFSLPAAIDTKNAKPVRFGRSVIYPRFFAGAIDEVFIVDAALTGEEIRELMTTHRMPSSNP